MRHSGRCLLFFLALIGLSSPQANAHRLSESEICSLEGQCKWDAGHCYCMQQIEAMRQSFESKQKEAHCRELKTSLPHLSLIYGSLFNFLTGIIVAVNVPDGKGIASSVPFFALGGYFFYESVDPVCGARLGRNFVK